MPRARAASSKEPATDYGGLPTEAVHPDSAHLDEMAADKVVAFMLAEEGKAARAAAARAPLIGRAAELVAGKLAAGGRLVYVGAGTSGRLGTLDATECVPTFGVPPSRVVAIIAGGPGALTRSVEGAEDSAREADQRLRRAAIGPTDAVCCIAASGVTPFVLASLETGPEVIAGSTRLKAGTATKMVLNAISTTAFVLLGKTYAGLMVDVRPTNAKLWARAVRIVRALTDLPEPAARKLIEKAGGRAKVALVMHHARVPAARARELLVAHKGSLRAIVGDVPLVPLGDEAD